MLLWWPRFAQLCGILAPPRSPNPARPLHLSLASIYSWWCPWTRPESQVCPVWNEHNRLGWQYAGELRITKERECEVHWLWGGRIVREVDRDGPTKKRNREDSEREAEGKRSGWEMKGWMEKENRGVRRERWERKRRGREEARETGCGLQWQEAAGCALRAKSSWRR